MFYRIVFLLLAFGSCHAWALSLDDLSNADAAGGVKQALTQGANKAVDSLSKVDGFLGNPKVKIPLPENLQKVEGLMRTLGMGSYADDLVTSMNRAAEAAVPQAKPLMVNAIRQMTLQDVKGILSGGSDAATQYFKQTTSAPLSDKLKPIVQQAMAKVQLAEKYNQFAGKGASLGLISDNDAHLENYVTSKALDGLYSMMADEEQAIRSNPMAAAGNLAQKAFGLLR
jgi:hypothetical protein